jgi:MFS family permease
VPLLALTSRWELAVLLIVLERTGKGIRTPARDAMLSHAGSQTGQGWGFGLHGALDQTGAVLGPLIVSVALYWNGSYRSGFAVLAIPALCAMTVLFAACHFFPRPRDLNVAPPDLSAGHLPRRFWVYVAATSLIAAGYVDFPLIAFHFGKTNLIAPVWIPAFYSLAMAADATASFLLGRLFDKIGIGAMILATCASALAAPLAFLAPPAAAMIGMVLWGIGMGAQTSVMRAAIAQLAPASKRGTAYGIFNTAYGLAWFAGSSLLGVLYGWSVGVVAAASAALQVAGFIILWPIPRSARRAHGTQW